jgi:transcriptional regulator with XRE-family HTH domain
MNDLQKLFALRGITMAQLAAAIGEGYHPTQKTVKQARYTDTRSGRAYVRRNPRIREKIAAYLKLPYDQVWGPEAPEILQRILTIEIERQGQATAAASISKLKSLYLRDNKSKVPDRDRASND